MNLVPRNGRKWDRKEDVTVWEDEIMIEIERIGEIRKWNRKGSRTKEEWMKESEKVNEGERKIQ